MHKILTIIRLIRVRQWVKNLFVLLPLVFGGGLLSRGPMSAALIAMVCFCLISSAVYIINDIADRKTDRLHPLKKTRPIASGEVSLPLAIGICVLFVALSVVGSILLLPGRIGTMCIIVAYLVLNIAYTFGLKQIAIIDVVIIAVGFVLRVFAGGVACGIVVSPWLAVMVFLLTLFIAFGKRRDDLIRVADGTGKRKSVETYNLQFVDQAMSLLAAAMIVAYVIYSLLPEVMARFNSQYVYLTSIFVIIGTLRYMQLATVKQRTGDPSQIVSRDPFMLLTILLWMVSFIFIIYG